MTRTIIGPVRGHPEVETWASYCHNDLDSSTVMRIAITGCSGNIGKRVVKRALAENFTVVGIDKNAPNSDLSHEGAFSFIKVDLTDYEATLKALENCEGIVHLAAIPRPRDYEVTTHNW